MDPQEEPQKLPLSTKVGIVITLINLIFMCLATYRWYNPRETTVRRTILNVSEMSCKHYLDIREFKDGKLINSAETCKDPEIQND